jgi:hypothetical protein
MESVPHRQRPDHWNRLRSFKFKIVKN